MHSGRYDELTQGGLHCTVVDALVMGIIARPDVVYTNAVSVDFFSRNRRNSLVMAS